MKGEHALLWLIEALNGERDIASVPNLMYRDATGLHQNNEVYTEKTTALPLPDFDGLPLDHYFVPERIIPYLATRGCYWGRCTFCDHGQGYFDQYRGMTAQQVVEQSEGAAGQVPVPAFPLLRRILSAGTLQEGFAASGRSEMSGIKWTTLIRFEETLQDQAIWDLAAKAGCCTLYYGMESANERVLNLMDKHAKKSVIQKQPPSGGEGGDLEPRDGLLWIPRRDAGRSAGDPPVRHREPAGDSLGGAVLLRGLSPYADGAQSGEVRHYDPQARGVRSPAGLLLHVE